MTAYDWMESGEKVHFSTAYDWLHEHKADVKEFYEDHPQYELAIFFLASDVFEWLGY